MLLPGFVAFCAQFEVYGSLLSPLVGVPLESMNRYEMHKGELFHADSIIQVRRAHHHPSAVHR